MAQLPGIEYRTPVESSASATEKPFQAFAGMTDSAAKAFQVYGQEQIKGQLGDAKARLSLGLASLKSEVNRKEYYSAAELKDIFGDDIPSGVRLYEDQEGFVERQVPKWEVADKVFAWKAKKLVDESAQLVEVPGWRAEFQDSVAAPLVGEHLQQVTDYQLASMHQDLKQRSLGRAQAYMTAGMFGEARSEVNGSQLLSPAEKEHIQGLIDTEEQSAPFVQLITDGINNPRDVLRAGELLGKLKDVREVPAVKDERRATFARAIRTMVDEYDHRSKKEVFKEADEAARNNVLGFVMRNPNSIIPMGLLPKPGTVSASVLEHLLGMREASVNRAKKDDKVETSPGAYLEVSNAITADLEGFKNNRIVGADGKVRPIEAYYPLLKPEHFYKFVDLQRTARENGAAVKSFISDEELVNHFLTTPRDRGGYGMDLKSPSDEEASIIFGAKEAATLALQEASRGPNGTVVPLDYETRKKVVSEALARNFQVKRTFWHPISGKTVPKLEGVDQAFTNEIYRRMRTTGTTKVNEDSIKELYKEFSGYAPGLEEAWMAKSQGKRLGMRQALDLWNFAQQKDIAAAVDATVGRMPAPSSVEMDRRIRAAIIVQLYMERLGGAARPRSAYPNLKPGKAH